MRHQHLDGYVKLGPFPFEAVARYLSSSRRIQLLGGHSLINLVAIDRSVQIQNQDDSDHQML
jgi:hypothetical protein